MSSWPGSRSSRTADIRRRNLLPNAIVGNSSNCWQMPDRRPWCGLELQYGFRSGARWIGIIPLLKPTVVAREVVMNKLLVSILLSASAFAASAQTVQVDSAVQNRSTD